jgi:UV DNA damage endonuclease
VHHHRCLPDDLSVEQATAGAIETWNREPLFHISSPLGGWQSARPQLHDDFIDPNDFPECWRSLDVTVEVEAKAKEVAIERLQQSLRQSEKVAHRCN